MDCRSLARETGLQHALASIRDIDTRPDAQELLSGKEDFVFEKLERACRTEIKKIEETLHAPIFADARWLAVQYLTRPEIVREVLPPPLEPAAEPLVTVGIGTLGRSNISRVRRQGQDSGRILRAQHR